MRSDRSILDLYCSPLRSDKPSVRIVTDTAHIVGLISGLASALPRDLRDAVRPVIAAVDRSSRRIRLARQCASQIVGITEMIVLSVETHLALRHPPKRVVRQVVRRRVGIDADLLAPMRFGRIAPAASPAAPLPAWPLQPGCLLSES